MTFDFWTNLIEGQPILSVLVWLAILMLVMYMARQPAHQVVMTLVRSVLNVLRLVSQSLGQVVSQLRIRNREVLMAYGEELAERFIEREFQRVESLVKRDLSGYPSLQRDLKEQIARIDDDYVQSGEVPPKPPEWLKAVETVAEIPDNGSPVVGKILNDIHITLQKSLQKNMNEYRRANADRHNLLKKMMPYWRSLNNTVDSVEKKITLLEQRSVIIDHHMKSYEDIRNNMDISEHLLSSSSITRFVISALVLCLLTFGMYVNFQLVSLPMREIVGAASYLGDSDILASDVAALFTVSVEVIIGLFLMESVGVTRQFPVISLLEDHKRKTIFWIMLGFLVIFAAIQASLAYMHDPLDADSTALAQTLLLGGEIEEPPLRQIPALGQMAMGFTLPFVLAFAAIPLEIFIQSSRSVGGMFLVWVLNLIISLIRFIGRLIYGTGQILVSSYDLVIFIPLKIESSLKTRPQQKTAQSAPAPVTTKQHDTPSDSEPVKDA